MIDSHCHLDFKDYDGRRDEVVAAALRAGVYTMVTIGCDLPSSYSAVGLAERYETVYATVGVHPHDARTYDDRVEKELLDLAGHDRVVAIGEIGLDFYRDLSPRQVQARVFRRQLELAVKTKLPVVIHTREAFRETIDIIRDFAPKLVGGIFHCFPGTADDAREVIDLGFYISVGGMITFPKANMARMAAEVPLEKILLETDSPYLAPVPNRGKTNQPAYVRHVAEKLAELQERPPAEIEKITDRNCRKVFGLVETFGG